MATIPRFDPPGDLDDFSQPVRQAWDRELHDYFQENVARAKAEARGTSQFYNPKVTSTDPPFATKVIRWKAFPLVILSKHPGDKRAAWEDAERPKADGSRRQDEYLEWHVTRNAQEKITRVAFTCEGPEYWRVLAENDRPKLLALYRQHISPDVREADLFRNGTYDPLNRWNTKQGAMHLSHEANSLGAEINIAALATVLRKRGNRVLTDAQELIECSGYGVAGRASDPHIGEEVNALAREGYAITLQNPVGLYIAEAPKTTGWQTPDGTPASQFWKVTRGTPDMIVRAVFEVPAAKGYTVGEIKIGGQPIEWGGQIAEFLDVKLTGVACRKGGIENEPQPCPGEGPAPFAAVAAGTRLPSRRGSG